MTYYLLILLGIWHHNGVYSYESGSAETNKLEITPYYDTIIFGDVADILNEFNNVNAPLEAIIGSGSESEENMEDLLTEYQTYLYKAHKQKIDYLEKNRIDTKNKVPLIRHERFSKNKPGVGVKYDDVYYNAGYYSPSIQQPSYSNPIDLFLPTSQTISKLLRSEFPPLPVKETNEETPYDKKVNNFHMQQRSESVQPTLKKPCKMCMMSHGPMTPSYMLQNNLPSDGDSKTSVLNSEYMNEDNTLNIRIKVDIQLPKLQDNLGKFVKNRSREEDINSKETSLNVPFPYFNFPIPMSLFGYKRLTSSKYNKHDLGHHKKRKSRTSNNKKHKKKVKVTWTDTPQYIDVSSIPYHLDEKNYRNEPSLTYIEKSESKLNNETGIGGPKSKPDRRNNSTQTTEKKIYVTVNISSATGNLTEETHKENSVETDYTTTTNAVVNKAKPVILQRVRRDLTQKPETHTNEATKILPAIVKPVDIVIASSKNISQTKTSKITAQQMVSAKGTDVKKSEKVLAADKELTYWPENAQNKTSVESVSHNITTIILEREKQKAKLNMSKEAIHDNHTTALEKAIFGDVNWEDVDTIAPVFMSFVGKYLNGVLTFCSQNVCHSMKCSGKACVHRICKPEHRWNQRGHCAGSNTTDSVASLESIMDLPSNIAFEIVDILQEKMLGKMYGSVTLCITSKCVSFVTSKRNFLKTKCSAKELNNGQCPTAKKTKLM